MLAQQLDSRGFAIIPNIFTANDFVPLMSELSGESLKRSRAGMRHALSLPSVANLARDMRLLRIAETIVGSGGFPFRATLFEKSGRSNWLVAWHQDTALPLQEQRDTFGWGPWSVKDGVVYAHAPANALSRVLAIRVHLDNSTQDNGPLRVLPGTHNQGVLTDEEIHSLSVNRSMEECLVPIGGILVMRPLLVHASSKARNQISRRVLHIEYAASTRIGDGLELAIS
jgi:ectoine hydroxylase-related dioxygenase (phytanoyl-CoA dioxygenase family)